MFQPTIPLLARILDRAFGTYLAEQVLTAYKYLMDTHNDGDKIIMFGMFSDYTYMGKLLNYGNFIDRVFTRCLHCASARRNASQGMIAYK